MMSPWFGLRLAEPLARDRGSFELYFAVSGLQSPLLTTKQLEFDRSKATLVKNLVANLTNLDRGSVCMCVVFVCV